MLNYLKLKKVKAKIHRKVEGTIVNVIVKKYPSGKYYCMILVRKEIEELEKSNYIIALDMGVKTFAKDNMGNVYISPRSLKDVEEDIAILQRKLEKKKKKGANYEKLRKKIARRYERCENIRNNFLQELSNKIIKENQVIILEDLNVEEMFKKKTLAKVLGDISISRFITMLEYKARYYGRKVIKINRYYPSSQLCSCCGYKNKEVKDLSIRTWLCPNCGIEHDRDINAANNILDEGFRLLFA